MVNLWLLIFDIRFKYLSLYPLIYLAFTSKKKKKPSILHHRVCYRIPQLSKLQRTIDSGMSDPNDDSTKFKIIPRLWSHWRNWANRYYDHVGLYVSHDGSGFYIRQWSYTHEISKSCIPKNRSTQWHHHLVFQHRWETTKSDT